ncbi:MAG TPA: M13 family metallopeptidase [Burkholderiaceae bacterium]
MTRTRTAAALAALAVVVVAAVATAADAQTAAPAETRAQTAGIDPGAMDLSVRPQDDLWLHANGRWLANTPFPPDKAYIGVGQQLGDRTREQLRALVEAAQRTPEDREAAQLGEMYASFMDEATLEQRGLQPLHAELAAIDTVTDKRQLAALFARLGLLGVGNPLGLYIGVDDRDSTRYVPFLGQAGLSLPNRDYYLKVDDEKFKAVRAKLVEYHANLLKLAGANPNDAQGSAQAILALETEIARAQWSQVQNRDPIKTYNLTTLEALPGQAPAFDWTAYLNATGLAGKTPNLVVRQPSYLKGLGALLDSVPLATWKSYARVHLLSDYAPYLNKAYVDERFAFVGGVLAGTTQNRPRWERGVRLLDEHLGEALGKLYVEKHFPAESKRRMDEMVANLLAAYRQSITKLDWMGPQTRQRALEKLAKFNAKIGYPKRWIDYRAIEIKRDDLVGNVMRARAFEEARQVHKLGKPVDRDEWLMTPQTINAYYDASLNEIVFPAAYLQPPYFDPAADDAFNYGSVGATIGHEISHGFDDEGSQYDGDGNLKDWWTAADRKRFTAKTQALVAQYSAFEAVPGYHVNGELTLGENIADNSGLAIAWKAYQLSLHGKKAPVIAGTTGDQRFFLGYAQSWRGKERPEALLAQIKSDPHSPDEFRVIGPVRNLNAFYSTFKVKPGDKMYLAPKDRVSIW